MSRRGICVRNEKTKYYLCEICLYKEELETLPPCCDCSVLKKSHFKMKKKHDTIKR